MPQVYWTPVAQADLDDLLFYIALADRRPATAERIYYEIRDKVNHHARLGAMGLHHPAAPEGWAYLKHKRWLIFYQQHPDGIEVMRVVDAVRDLPRQLREIY